MSNLRVAPATLFLGAGASRAFGFPTTKEFLQVLPERLPLGKTRDLLSYLTSTPEITDIEHVLSILDQVVELENPLLKYMAHHNVPMYMMTWKDFVDTATLLRASIRDELFRLYEFDPDKRDTIQSSYEELMDDICGNADCIHVFTTNYDSVVEEGLINSEKYLVIDGFRRKNSGPAIWDSRILTRPKRIHRGKKHVFLYKLHGSLGWRLDKESTRIMRVDTEEKAAEANIRMPKVKVHSRSTVGETRIHGDESKLSPPSLLGESCEPTDRGLQGSGSLSGSLRNVSIIHRKPTGNPPGARINGPQSCISIPRSA